MNTFIVDTHTHSFHSHDSDCPISEMADWQIKKGTSAFAVTNHNDIFLKDSLDLASNTKKAHKDILEAKKLYSDKIDILAGTELGDGVWFKDEAFAIAELCDFDVIIGSVHSVRFNGKTGGKELMKMDLNVAYDYLKYYFQELYETASVLPIDILAHITYPLRYIECIGGNKVNLNAFQRDIEDIFKEIISRKIALEVNTSCLAYENGFLMPNEELLTKYKLLGGTLITLASDAHTGEKAAYRFDSAISAVKKLGFENCFYYKKRKAVSYKI